MIVRLAVNAIGSPSGINAIATETQSTMRVGTSIYSSKNHEQKTRIVNSNLPNRDAFYEDMIPYRLRLAVPTQS